MMMDLTLNQTDLIATLPAIVLVVAALAVLLLGLVPQIRPGWLLGIGVVGAVLASLTGLMVAGERLTAYGGMIVSDRLAIVLVVLVAGSAAAALLVSASAPARGVMGVSEYTALVLLSAAGMTILATGNDLIVVLLALELLSVGLYVLTGSARAMATGEEGALKYFLMGAFALGFLVYGSALVYGATGTTNFDRMAMVLGAPGIDPGTSLYLRIGVGMLLVGFAFKLSLVPFHMWTPDAYQAAPTAVTGFMAVGTKAVVFAALFRLLGMALMPAASEWTNILWVLAALTMILGNVAAIAQTSLKRLLAYSSIAHAGYVTLALFGTDAVAIRSGLIYLLIYGAMTTGAFAVIAALAPAEDDLYLEDLAGLAVRSPWLAFAFAVFLLSLAGVPPTGGFFAKLAVFTTAIQTGHVDLAILGVLTSVIGAFSYLRPLMVMYTPAPGTGAGRRSVDAARPSVPWPVAAVVFIAVLATLQLGIFPGLIDVLPGTAVLALH